MRRTILKILIGTALFAVSETGIAQTQTQLSKTQSTQSTQVKIPMLGWADVNGDGINDHFVDADGNGINDLTNEHYLHNFKYVDNNNDKINDIFIDADGDGVNDLSDYFVDVNGDGINDNVLDFDKNRMNDVTGHRYSNRKLGQSRLGIMNPMALFKDENGDGINDLLQRGMMIKGKMIRKDQFIDENGDGVHDGRGFSKMRGMMRKKKKGGGGY